MDVAASETECLPGEASGNLSGLGDNSTDSEGVSQDRVSGGGTFRLSFVGLPKCSREGESACKNASGSLGIGGTSAVGDSINNEFRETTLKRDFLREAFVIIEYRE